MAALAVTGAVVVAAPAAAAATTGSVSGRITLPSGAPAEWMKGVSVSASGIAAYGSVAVDPVTGTYAIADLKPGQYKVQFQINSYYNGITSVWPNLVTEYYGGTGYSDATAVDVSAGTDRGGISATLLIGQKITGKLTVPSGSGLDPSSWQGSISASNYEGGMSSGSSAVFDSSTNTIKYEVAGLRPGSSYSLYYSPNQSSLLVGGYLGGGTIVDFGVLEQYAAGATVDAALIVGGKITSTITLPVGGVNDFGTGSVEYVREGSAQTSIGGFSSATPYDPATRKITFVSTALRPGSYLIRWNPRSYSAGASDVSKNEQLWWPNGAVRSAGTPKTITAGAAVTADFSPRRSSTVTGQAQLPAGQAFADLGAYVSVTVLSEGQAYSSSYFERTEPVGASALVIPFELEVPTDSPYSVRASVSQSSTDPLKPWRDWSKEVEGATVATGKTGSVGNLTLSSPNSISGILTTANLPDASTYGEAVLYKRSGSEWEQQQSTGGWSGEVDGNKSRYNFSNIPAGTYTVGFAARSSSTGLSVASTPQFWDHKSTLAQATQITVTADSRFENIDGDVVIPATVPPVTGGLGTGAVSIKGPNSELLPGVKVEIRKNTCDGPAVWLTTTSDRPDAYGAFGIGLDSGKYCVKTLSVPAPYLLPADVEFTMEKRAANWVTVWVPKGIVKTVVTGAVVAKDAQGVPINGVKAHISEGTCASAGRGVWENTTAANRWAQGGFGISLDEGVHCITPLAVPAGYKVPAPFEVTVTSPSPYWVTVWVPSAA